jgi:hypothetical protein
MVTWQTNVHGSFDPQRLSGALANRVGPITKIIVHHARASSERRRFRLELGDTPVMSLRNLDVGISRLTFRPFFPCCRP